MILYNLTGVPISILVNGAPYLLPTLEEHYYMTIEEHLAPLSKWHDVPINSIKYNLDLNLPKFAEDEGIVVDEDTARRIKNLEMSFSFPIFAVHNDHAVRHRKTGLVKYYTQLVKL